MKLALEIGRRTRDVILPEGVALHYEVAGAGDRAAAFALDLCVVVAATLVCIVLMVMGGCGEDLGFALALLAIFLIRNAYFVWFEAHWRGQTPGKRAMGIRVISRDGGPLRPSALMARNLTRELEVFMPGLMLAFPEVLGADRNPGYVLLSLVWMFLIGFMPLFNRDRLRVGDLLGGTLVVRMPTAKLAVDEVLKGAASPAAITFTAEQLGNYGIYELQILEDVLRERFSERRTLSQVTRTIQRRIGWSRAEPVEPRDFLRAFYRAQREHLEHALLLGRARERKRAMDGGEEAGGRRR